MKNVLFITAKIHPNSAQGIRYKNLYRHLASAVNITHITYDGYLFNPENCKNISVVKKHNSKLLFLLIKTINYILNKITYPDRFILLIRAYSRVIIDTITNKEFESVIICMTPFSFYKLGKIIKKTKPELALIADLSDPFTGSAEALGKIFFNNSIRKIFESKYIMLFDKIVVLNEKIKTYYSRTFNFSEKNIVVIEQGIDENFVKSFEETDIKAQLHADSLNFVYAGGFYKHFREPFFLYAAIEDLAHNITLDIYGGIKKKFLPQKSKRIFYHGLISNSEIINKLATANVVVMIDNNFGIQVPGKTIECLTIPKPVLFIYDNDASPTLTYIREAEGVIICKNTINDIKNALEFIFENYYSIVKTYDYSKLTWQYLTNKYLTDVIRD